MIITISGNAGSGKSTLAEMLEKKLKMKRYYMGGIRRALAKKRGMTLAEYNKLGEKDPSTDREVDDYQTELGKKKNNIIVEGRTSFYFIPNSLKVYLYCDPREGARRIWKSLAKDGAKRNEGKGLTSYAAVLRSVRERQKSDMLRYKKYYHINVYDKRHYDIVVDTTKLGIKQVFEKMLKEIKKHK
jgi:predicted cytidylate kinase